MSETTATPGTTTTATTETPSWLDAVDGEVKGFWANKGWDTDPHKLAVQATAAYREAEKFIGVSPDQIVRLPKAGDANAQKALWQRLGMPAEATGYDFAGVKFADGTDPEASFIEQFRGAAHAHGLSADAAKGMAGAMVKYLDGVKTGESADEAAKLQAERDALQRNWGANMDANKFIASQAVARLGLKPETVAALESVVGYSQVMEMFRDIGTRIGEHTYVSGNNPQNNGVMSVDQAKARQAELKQDPTWVRGYLNGDNDKVREMTSLNTIIAGAMPR